MSDNVSRPIRDEPNPNHRYLHEEFLKKREIQILCRIRCKWCHPNNHLSLLEAVERKYCWNNEERQTLTKDAVDFIRFRLKNNESNCRILNDFQKVYGDDIVISYSGVYLLSVFCALGMYLTLNWTTVVNKMKWQLSRYGVRVF